MGRVVQKRFSKKQEKGYKKLLTGKDEIPMVEEYKKAVAKVEKSGNVIMRCNDLNKEAFEDIILSIDYTTKQGKVAFSLIKNCKMAKYPEGSYTLAWDHLIEKESPKTVPLLLKLKKHFANSQLESVDTHPVEWMMLSTINVKTDVLNNYEDAMFGCSRTIV